MALRTAELLEHRETPVPAQVIDQPFPHISRVIVIVVPVDCLEHDLRFLDAHPLLPQPHRGALDGPPNPVIDALLMFDSTEL